MGLISFLDITICLIRGKISLDSTGGFDQRDLLADLKVSR
jgi:hypothetical protein